MAATNKKIDAIRRLILGPFYTECRDNPLGVKREDLEAHFEELKREGCVGGDCGFDEMIKLCQLKSHYPTCLSDNRGCIEDMGERSTGVKKFYYNEYKKAKLIEDEEDESSSDEEEEEIECPICMMNEDENGVRLVETVTNPEEEQGKLSCGHLVHKSCLIKTAVTKGKDRAECPLCHTVFDLNEVPVPVRDAATSSRDTMRRAIFNGTQMGRTFEEIADVYGLGINQLLERIGMTAEEASAYYSIPLESIEAPVNRRLDFGSDDEEEDEGEEAENDVIENIIEHIQNDDIEVAIQMTEEKIDEEGNNTWVTPDVIREILNGILSLDRRRYLDNLLKLFLLTYHDNIINYQNDMNEFISNSMVQMFRTSTTKKGIAKLILLHIIKEDSIGMYYILVHILKSYDRITPSTENEVITFIFQSYNGFTERNEPVAEIHNETDGNTVLKGFLNDVLEEIHNWNNTSDVSDLIREWFDEHYPGEFEREEDVEEIPIIDALIARNYELALELITDRNERESDWVSENVLTEFFSRMKEQTDLINRQYFQDIFNELMGESFYELIADNLNETYTSGVQAQKVITKDCLNLMIEHNFNLIFNVIVRSLQKSYFELCRGIFEVYDRNDYMGSYVAQPSRRRGEMSPKEVIILITEDILDDINIMNRMEDRDGAVDLINEFFGEESDEEESDDE